MEERVQCYEECDQRSLRGRGRLLLFPTLLPETGTLRDDVSPCSSVNLPVQETIDRNVSVSERVRMMNSWILSDF